MSASDPEPSYELRPHDLRQPSPSHAGAKPRWKGPGRLELGYQARIRQLEEQSQQVQAHEAELEDQLQAAQREAEMAALVERGTSRRMDRLEEEREQERAEMETLREQGNRLLVALGALQRENELLRDELGGALPAGERLKLRRGKKRR